ncbi:MULTISPECIES: hypothetical protein [Maribacter]|uniref:Uncharacterized protein n=2 Tax=Maribacter TaxID=252356 RepID=A0A1T4ZVI1_9FLAO|nr:MULTISPECIES: hypothetical protein [Maribacter]SKB26698.1 hypothetical protein SAMN05660866_00370 [Maribacter arcticus]|tara:strand:- start:512 stop:691 length:180 start_codon:yes stop_codon:yes gene_type:complete
MMTFLTIFLVLVGINIAMVVVSLLSVSQKSKQSSQELSNQHTSVIYPLDLLTSSYKKAV